MSTSRLQRLKRNFLTGREVRCSFVCEEDSALDPHPVRKDTAVNEFVCVVVVQSSESGHLLIAAPVTLTKLSSEDARTTKAAQS